MSDRTITAQAVMNSDDETMKQELCKQLVREGYLSQDMDSGAWAIFRTDMKQFYAGRNDANRANKTYVWRDKSGVLFESLWKAQTIATELLNAHVNARNYRYREEGFEDSFFTIQVVAVSVNIHGVKTSLDCAFTDPSEVRAI